MFYFTLLIFNEENLLEVRLSETNYVSKYKDEFLLMENGEMVYDFYTNDVKFLFRLFNHSLSRIKWAELV